MTEFINTNIADTPRQNISSVVKGYSNRLFGFIRPRVPITVDAEDILQEVWSPSSRVVDTDSP